MLARRPPVSVQVTIAAGLAVTNLKIDFGDGTSSTLGGATVGGGAPHVYTAVKCTLYRHGHGYTGTSRRDTVVSIAELKPVRVDRDLAGLLYQSEYFVPSSAVASDALFTV